MAKIPSWVFIGTGLFVSIVSLFRYAKFKIFFYAGLIFIVVGMVKLFSKSAKSEGELSSTHQKAHQAHKSNPQIKYCHQCGSPMRLHERFCMRCGARV